MFLLSVLFCLTLTRRWSWSACSSFPWSCPASLSRLGPRFRLFIRTFRSAQARHKQRWRKSALRAWWWRFFIYPRQWSSPGPGGSSCSPGRSSPRAASGSRCTGLPGRGTARGPKRRQFPVSALEMMRWPRPWCHSLLHMSGCHGDKEKGTCSEVSFFCWAACEPARVKGIKWGPRGEEWGLREVFEKEKNPEASKKMPPGLGRPSKFILSSWALSFTHRRVLWPGCPRTLAFIFADRWLYFFTAFSPEKQQRAGDSVSYRCVCCVQRLVVVVELVDQHRESIQAHVVMVVSVVLLRVCELVYEEVGLGAPLVLLRCRADQVGWGEVEQTAGSKNRELRHGDAEIFLSVFTSSISEGDLVADQLVNGLDQVTLFTKTPKNTDQII